ncbi:hypothetical protein DUNSADRAFT_15104, partial [Dunaliella salina]
MYTCRKVSSTSIAVAFPVGRPEALEPSAAAKDEQGSQAGLAIPTEPPAGQVYAFLPISAIFGLPFELQADWLLTASHKFLQTSSSWNPAGCLHFFVHVCTFAAGRLAADRKPQV